MKNTWNFLHIKTGLLTSGNKSFYELSTNSITVDLKCIIEINNGEDTDNLCKKVRSIRSQIFVTYQFQ